MTMQPRHYLDLKDANIISTAALTATVVMLDSVSKHNGIAVVEGDAGVGKTFSLAYALALRPKLDFIWITLPTDATARLVSQKIVEALTGIPSKKIERNELLRLKALKLLLQRLPGIVIDEAQNLDRDGAENVRYLHDSCGCQFPIILSGGEGCWEAIADEPMLLSRIFDTVEHSPQREQDIFEFLPNYHPTYKGVSADLVRHVNDRYCHGEFRKWAAFTLKATDYTQASGKALNMSAAVKILRTFPKKARTDMPDDLRG